MSGKWDDPFFPKRGWECVEVFDLGEPQQTCEMCEKVQIRYVHVMRHIMLPEPLETGCICAGHLEENEQAARDREDMFIKRERFALRKHWVPTAKGERIHVDGFRIVVFRRDGGWRVVINIPGEWSQFGGKTYPDMPSAKKGAFDAYVYAKKKFEPKAPIDFPEPSDEQGFYRDPLLGKLIRIDQKI